jgi:hypothetical protein
VEGFSDLSSQLAVGADSVVLAVCMRSAPFWGAFVDVELVFQLSCSCYCIRFFHILYLLYSTFCFPHIYIHIPNRFSPGGGVIQGHVNQKYLCLQMHVLVS